jgi:hypothetical protein
MPERRKLTVQEGDELLAHLSPWLAGGLGFVASCLALLSIFGFLYILLTVTGLFRLTGEWARRSVEGEATYGMGLWRALGAILLGSVVNVLTSLWSARLGFIIFGVFGCLCGLIVRRVVRLDPRLGGIGSFLFFFLSALYLVVPGILYVIGGSEALFDVQLSLLAGAEVDLEQAVFSSFLSELFVGVFFALVIAILAWELWRLSCASLLGWAVFFSPGLRRGLLASTRQRYAAPPAMDDWRAYPARLRELKVDEEALEQARWRRPKPEQERAAQREPVETYEPAPTAISPPVTVEEEPSLADRLVGPSTWALVPAIVLLPLCVLGLNAIRPSQARVAARTQQRWAVVLSPEQTENTSPVEIVYRPHVLTVIKMTGGGVISAVMTGPQPSQDAVWTLERWDLTEHPFTREYSIEHLQPGLYELTFRFEGRDRDGYGEAGLGYTYGQGGGPVAQRLGLAAGLMLATAFVATATILAAVILRGVVILQRSRPSGM